MWRWVLPVAALAAVLIGFMASHNGSTSHVDAHGTPTTAPPATPGPHPDLDMRQPHGHPEGAAPCGLDPRWAPRATTHRSARPGRALHNSARRRSAAFATAYSSITHPAIANDVGVLAGDPHGLVHNACAPCTTTAASLLSQVHSWRAFVGGMPGPCRKLAARPGTRGSPTRPPTSPSAGCRRFDVPLGTTKRQPAAGARGKRAAGVLADRARRLRRHLLQQALRRDAEARELRRPRRPVAAQLVGRASRRPPPISPAPP